jgi:2-hydroxychromene-2-carboxylate isomerase
MKGPIEFNFDFASPYSYFMAERLDAIARACGRDVIWRPLILWTVLKMHGLPAPLEHPVKKSYVLRDMERSACFHDLPFRLPTRFPASSHLPARAFYWLLTTRPDAAKPFAQRVFQAYFVDDIDINSADDIARCLAGVAGISEEGRARCAQRRERENYASGLRRVGGDEGRMGRALRADRRGGILRRRPAAPHRAPSSRLELTREMQAPL